MARFILDVANLNNTKDFMDRLFDTSVISKEIAEIRCIDETNENQFYMEEEGFSKIKTTFEDIMLWNHHLMNYIISDDRIEGDDEYSEKGYLELTPMVLKLSEELLNSEYIDMDASHSETVLVFLRDKGLISENFFKRNV